MFDTYKYEVSGYHILEGKTPAALQEEVQKGIKEGDLTPIGPPFVFKGTLCQAAVQLVLSDEWLRRKDV